MYRRYTFEKTNGDDLDLHNVKWALNQVVMMNRLEVAWFKSSAMLFRVGPVRHGRRRRMGWPPSQPLQRTSLIPTTFHHVCMCVYVCIKESERERKKKEIQRMLKN